MIFEFNYVIQFLLRKSFSQFCSIEYENDICKLTVQGFVHLVVEQITSSSYTNPRCRQTNVSKDNSKFGSHT